jgi:uncharacterized protein YhaN
MRLRRLDLIRFGRFTDAAFVLPEGEMDFHIVYGPNEAGKSTALAAIEDLLFGIHGRSPYDFLHDYKNMRVGAVLEKNGSVLEVRRRKGTKDTLLGVDDLPLSGADGTLRPFLESADRTFFERMFSLDHVRLEQGGKEILSASDEVGQLLFSAGAGIGGLRDRLAKLDEEADSLWGSRKAQRRLYTKAEERLNESQRLLREHTLTAKTWNDLRRAYEGANERCDKIETEIRTKSADAKRLSRIRRVYRYLGQKGELERHIKDLGAVVALPEDAADTLKSAERDESIASGRIDTVANQLKRASEDLEGLGYDETLVARAKDIGALNERRIEIRGEKAALPKRQAELEAAEKDLEALAKELEWQDATADELAERIPARSIVKTVSTLLGKREALDSAVSNATKEVEEADSEVLRLQQQIDGFGDLADVSNLNAAVKAVREMGDVADRALSAKQRVLDTTKRIARLITSLNPPVESESDIAAIKVPSDADIQKLRDDIRNCQQHQRENDRDLEVAQDELATAQTELEQRVRDGHAITEAELKESRNLRDALWNLVKRKHIEGGAIGEEELSEYAEELQDLPRSFEEKKKSADDIADDRFDNAEASGRLAVMSRSMELKAERIEQLQARAARLKSEGEALAARWKSMWDDAPFEPLSPDSMLEWLKGRGALLDAIETRAVDSSESEKSDAQEQEAKESLLTETAALGIDRANLEEAHLRVILERASELQQHHAGEEGRLAQMKDSLADAKHEAERRQREAQRANEAWRAWEEEWVSALERLGVAANLHPAAVEAQIDVIDHMRMKQIEIRNLRHERIAKIKRDIKDFEDVTATLVQAVAQDLGGMPADDAVLQLAERLNDAERVRDLQAGKRKDVREREQEILELEGTRDTARSSLRHLHDAAGTDSVDALRQAIARSDQLREYRSKLIETVETLKNEGDGLGVVELEQERSAVDVDEIAAIEETNASDLKELEERRTEATDVRSEARRAFETVGGDDAAASAEADRQEALTEMGEVAARYARVRTSAILLKWAIDRFRREKQAPLLRRAGELFASLTAGSFSGLRIDYDENDAAQLIGHRRSGENVEVKGMSSGTADQLYLALRVASVEDYLDRAGGLPFVADDLFINFDDERAAAGFRVLGQLADKTQVLFFTHHQHLVDIAREALGALVNVVTLDGAEGSSA